MPKLILTQYISHLTMSSSFRWDYLRRFGVRGGPFPGFDKFRQGGVETEYLESVFPSESFPAWQTINTGWFLLELLSINPILYEPRQRTVIRRVLHNCTERQFESQWHQLSFWFSQKWPTFSKKKQPHQKINIRTLKKIVLVHFDNAASPPAEFWDGAAVA